MALDRGSDNEVLAYAVDWLDAGDSVTLATVTQTWGSSPRRPGAMMVINGDGRFAGSVSGGCIEDELVQRALKGEFENALPRLLEYGVGSKVLQKTGLPCGGRLVVMVEHLNSAAQLRALLQAMADRRQVQRHVCLATGETSLRPVTQELKQGDGFSFDGDNLVKVFGPGLRLLLFGAGELARRVAQLALTLDYAVTLCDARPEYAHNWRVDGADFSTAAPAQTIAQFKPDRCSAIIALAHTPSIDDAALLAALQSDAFYVGALGSAKHQAARRRRLLQQGLSATQLERLRGPVGLDIGSRTPAEIAIAIMAGLIAERNAATHSLEEVNRAHG